MKWTGPGLWSFLKTSKERRKKRLVIWQLIPSPQSPALKRHFSSDILTVRIHTITLHCMHTYILFSICKVLCIASFRWSTHLSTRLYTTSASFHPVVFSAKMFNKQSYRFSDLQLSPTIHVCLNQLTGAAQLWAKRVSRVEGPGGVMALSSSEGGQLVASRTRP